MIVLYNIISVFGLLVDRNIRIFFPEFVQFFNGNRFSFPSAAAGTHFIDDAGISANRIPVHRMVHGTVPDAALLHAPDDCFERFRILRRIPVQLHIADMPGIGQRMKRRFNPDFLKGMDGIGQHRLTLAYEQACGK